MHHHSLSEETFPYIQPKPHLAQLKAIPSWRCLGKFSQVPHQYLASMYLGLAGLHEKPSRYFQIFQGFTYYKIYFFCSAACLFSREKCDNDHSPNSWSKTKMTILTKGQKTICLQLICLVVPQPPRSKIQWDGSTGDMVPYTDTFYKVCLIPVSGKSPLASQTGALNRDHFAVTTSQNIPQKQWPQKCCHFLFILKLWHYVP